MKQCLRHIVRLDESCRVVGHLDYGGAGAGGWLAIGKGAADFCRAVRVCGGDGFPAASWVGGQHRGGFREAIGIGIGIRGFQRRI